MPGDGVALAGARVQDETRGGLAGAAGGDPGQLLEVDGLGERLTHGGVVAGPVVALVVEELAVLERFDRLADAGGGLQTGAVGADDDGAVQAAGDEQVGGGLLVRHDLHHRGLRDVLAGAALLAPGVLPAGLEGVVVARHRLGELVGAAARGAALQQRAVLETRAADDVERAGGLQDEAERLRHRQGHGAGRLVGLGLHAGGHDHAVDGRLGGGIGDVVDAVGHVGGFDGRAVGAGGVLAHGEGDLVGLDRPLLRQEGHGLAVLGDADQGVVGEGQRGDGDVEHGPRRVEHAGVGREGVGERAAPGRPAPPFATPFCASAGGREQGERGEGRRYRCSHGHSRRAWGESTTFSAHPRPLLRGRSRKSRGR